VSVAFNVGIASSPAQDSVLQDQLKSIQKNQIDAQLERLNSERLSDSSLKKDFLSRSQIGKGVATIVTSSLNTDTTNIDVSQYPLGIVDALTLNEYFDKDKSVLIITAVGRDGPPLAAKKYKVANIRFPFFFELTTNDLLFPYNTEVWATSPLSSDAISLACILDTDGVLSSPSQFDRFGFAISDPIVKDDVVTRREAQVNIQFPTDGRPYEKSEIELLKRIDSELEKKGFSEP
jgi:hypothetical protein